MPAGCTVKQHVRHPDAAIYPFESKCFAVFRERRREAADKAFSASEKISRGFRDVSH